MDNAELRKIIDQYVDDRYYDKDKTFTVSFNAPNGGYRDFRLCR